MSTTIRDLEPSDVPELLSLMRALAAHSGHESEVSATEETLSAKFFDDPKVFARILELDGQIIGYTIWWITFAGWYATHGMWLSEIYVLPEHRRSGHGQFLIDDLRRICEERQFHGIGWWAEKDNAEGAAFYERIGARLNTTRNLYGILLSGG